MGFNTVQLPGFVIADLYKKSLIGAAGMEEARVTTQLAEGYSYLGNNEKKISIVVRSSEVVFLPDAELQLLTKMLEACKINIGDVAIMNQARSTIAISLLKTELEPKVLILFGLEPTAIGLPFNTAIFKIQDYDGCKYLYAPALETLLPATEEAKLLKSKLWVCLRSLFEV